MNKFILAAALVLMTGVALAHEDKCIQINGHLLPVEYLDINGDEYVGIRDALIVLQHVVGLRPAINCEIEDEHDDD